MYVSPLANSNVKTPKDYTNRARDEVNKKLNLSIGSSHLKHGSSPLKNDLTLTKTNSNDSLNSQMSTDNLIEGKKHKKFFGLTRLKQMATNHSQSSMKSVSSSEDVQMTDDAVSVVDPLAVNYLQPLHPVPSIASTDSQYSNASYASSLPSVQTNYTAKNSLFSNQNSLSTQITNVSNYSIPNLQQQLPQQSTKQAVITLQDVIPRDFNDMYAPELLADPGLLIDGRPMFTKRALLDWELNDIRSLLIVEKLRPEWNNQLPLIYTPQGFQMAYLPLDSDDQTIIKTLVESDIYKEAKFDPAFRIQTAKYTLYTARSRHAQILKNSGLPVIYNNRFSKPEWRNVIENFLLNLAVEAQCRYDFKKSCHDLKKFKRNQDSGIPSNPNGPSTFNLTNGKNSLLRKAIMNEVSQTAGATKNLNDYKLTKEEKAQLWTDVQSKVYNRLGLDWTPDSI